MPSPSNAAPSLSSLFTETYADAIQSIITTNARAFGRNRAMYGLDAFARSQEEPPPNKIPSDLPPMWYTIWDNGARKQIKLHKKDNVWYHGSVVYDMTKVRMVG